MHEIWSAAKTAESRERLLESLDRIQAEIDEFGDVTVDTSARDEKQIQREVEFLQMDLERRRDLVRRQRKANVL